LAPGIQDSGDKVALPGSEGTEMGMSPSALMLQGEKGDLKKRSSIALQSLQSLLLCRPCLQYEEPAHNNEDSKNAKGRQETE